MNIFDGLQNLTCTVQRRLELQIYCVQSPDLGLQPLGVLAGIGRASRQNCEDAVMTKAASVWGLLSVQTMQTILNIFQDFQIQHAFLEILPSASILQLSALLQTTLCSFWEEVPLSVLKVV